ncbi:MAG: translocation/assembly module TamB domain-containing protein, partial [bacterium]
MSGSVEASGKDLSLTWPTAALRVSEPTLALDMSDGRWTIREGRAALNGGRATLGGGRSPEGEIALAADLEDVRFRLAYGIDTLLDGRLAFTIPADPPGGNAGGNGRLAGKVNVERGVLDRDVNLDREVLTLLFAPAETRSTEESALAAVDLDLQVETSDGVRVKNNLGDLRATWRRLDLSGTLAEPILRGRIDLDPGGLLWAYGQTVRIDRGSMLLTGDPLTHPQVDLTTTSSLQDPRIARLRGESPLDLLEQQTYDRTTELRERDETGTGVLLAEGLTSYYGARFGQRLGESAGLRGFSVRPDLAFEGADPVARLVVARELSRYVSLALSLDLRTAEHETYLVSVARRGEIPGLQVEAFTNDSGHHGGSLQQSFELGGESLPAKGDTGPRLRRVRISTPMGGISRRLLRRAVRLEKKEPLPPGAAFGVEVDLAEHLRRRGYPNPRLTVATVPVTDRPGWMDLPVRVEPGPRVTFAFAGGRPSRALRREITDLYRTDFYEATAIEEMRLATVRAFRVRGHLDPQVRIELRRERPEDPDGPRTVTIHSEAGPRRSLETLALAGLDDESARLAAAAFPGTLA